MFGPDHFRNGEVLANLARYHVRAGRPAVADSNFRAAIGILDRVNDQSILTPIACRDHADVCRDLGRYAEAESLYARAEAGLDSANAGTRPYYGESLLGKARLLAREGRLDEAELMAASGFRIRAEDLTADAPELVDSWLAWAAVRSQSGDTTGALEKLRAAARCGATADDVLRFAELAVIRTRPGYPLDNSP